MKGRVNEDSETVGVCRVKSGTSSPLSDKLKNVRLARTLFDRVSAQADTPLPAATERGKAKRGRAAYYQRDAAR